MNGDDCLSAHLGDQLEQYVSQHLSGVVRLIRTKHREGLIRARIYGADHASGDVSNCFQSVYVSIIASTALSISCNICSLTAVDISGASITLVGQKNTRSNFSVSLWLICGFIYIKITVCVPKEWWIPLMEQIDIHCSWWLNHAVRDNCPRQRVLRQMLSLTAQIDWIHCYCVCFSAIRC